MRAIAVELDGALAVNDGTMGQEGEIGEPVDSMVRRLETEMRRGAKIVICSKRDKTILKRWLLDNGIPWDDIWDGVGKYDVDEFLDRKSK